MNHDAIRNFTNAIKTNLELLELLDRYLDEHPEAVEKIFASPQPPKTLDEKLREAHTKYQTSDIYYKTDDFYRDLSTIARDHLLPEDGETVKKLALHIYNERNDVKDIYITEVTKQFYESVAKDALQWLRERV